MIRQSNSWTYCVHWCILKPNVILGTRLPVQCSSNFKDCTCKILQNVYWWDSSLIGCTLHMWNVFQTWSQEDAATGLWSPPGLGSQLQSIDLSDFSFLFWERCYRSVLSDLHWGTAKWLRQVWCRGGICSIWQGNLYCFFHFDELKVLMFFFWWWDGVFSPRNQKVYGTYLQISWQLTLQKGSLARSWTPPSCSSQSPSPLSSTWPAPTTSATSPSPTPPSLGLQPLSSSTPKHPATSLQIC